VLTIGEFASLTHLSIRTLRRYHEAGLLVPAQVDASSGYRYYDAEQIPSAQVIHRLRELDLPLADVHQVMGTADPDERAGIVSAHLKRLEDRLERTRAAVSSLQQLLQPNPRELSVELRRVPAQEVPAISATLDADEIPEWYSGAWAELRAVVAEPLGALGGMYDNELFTEGRGHAVLYLPGAIESRGRVGGLTLPAVELAVAVHPGNHNSVDVTYGRLGRWVTEHALAVAGPVREHYLCGPRDTPDETAWRTEIAWPVFSVAGR
jgi:DNA-binding transcriptional MerR regulator